MIKGQWHDCGSAAQFEAALCTQGDDYVVDIVNQVSLTGQISNLKVSDRLGRVERKITLQDGSVFASDDNDAIDALFISQSKMVAILHTMESNMGWVLFALILTIASSFSFLRWGVPWVSTQIAHALPHKANDMISSHTLTFLDDYFFQSSMLDVERQNQIRQHFKTKLVPLDHTNSDVNYTLHFRQWGEEENSIPNAFALPSGDIILTDRFVELSENQDQIDSVLLHEMGHVVFRHTLETVVESTLLTTVVMMIAGDSNGLADMGVGLGSLLVSSNYSRGHESEADLYAFKKMLEVGIDPNSFSQIMTLITQDMEGSVVEENQSEHKTPKKTQTEGNGLLDYLSSHPSTAQRIEQAEKFSQCFKQGLRVCAVSESN